MSLGLASNNTSLEHQRRKKDLGMNLPYNKEDIVRRECRFAVMCEPPEDTGHGQRIRDDLHVIKEILHLKDGRQIPNVHLWKNYKRPFGITRPAFRDHEDKKEWEHLKKVQMYETPQSKLVESIARALDRPLPPRRKGGGSTSGLRQICRSPYVYGADIKSTALIKRDYLERFPGETSPFTLSCFDTETDVVHGHGEILMATLSCKTKVYTAIQKSFLEGVPDAINRLHQLAQKYLGNLDIPKKNDKGDFVLDDAGNFVLETVDLLKQRGIEWEFEIVENEVEVIRKTLAKAHEWKPDWFSIWNMDFDIPKVMDALKRNNIDPKDVFSDPKVPSVFRHFNYKQGPSQKVTASGKVTPIKPAARWHTVFTPASFYVVDGMCAYRHIRNGQQEEPSYSLDYILQKHLGIRKLKFKEADHVGGLKWHELMQTAYRLEYIIYNGFDCISMEMLDEVTQDLALSMPLLSGCSDFEDFKSQPRRVVDELHFAVQKSQNKIIGTTSDEMSGDHDELTVGLKDWIKNYYFPSRSIPH
jgi:hypothetical protein